MIIIYLFATVEQPYIACSKSTTNDLDIIVAEDISATIDGNKIVVDDKMQTNIKGLFAAFVLGGE